MLGGINEQQAAALNKILARAAEQLTMVTAIMQTTQIEARESVVERRPAEIRSLLADLERDYEVHVVGRQVKISWSYPQDDPLAIVSDGPKIRQILQNLIDNALKFTSEGSVTITARMAAQTPRVLELSVQDTGPGVAKDQQEIIFDKFYQVDSSERRLYGGVGLGLFIVKYFTELLGGEVRVESELGKGATFTVRIPAEDGAA